MSGKLFQETNTTATLFSKRMEGRGPRVQNSNDAQVCEASEDVGPPNSPKGRCSAKAGLLAAVLIWNLGARDSETQTVWQIGREVAIAKHLQDGEEFALALPDLLKHGENSSSPTGPGRKAADGRSQKAPAIRSATPRHRSCSRATSTGCRPRIPTRARVATIHPFPAATWTSWPTYSC